MQTLKFALLILSGMGFLQCERHSLSPSNTTVYFPMRIGNQWTYHVANNRDFVRQDKIVGTKTVGKYEYFVFERSFTPMTYVDSVLFRSEPDNRIIINRAGQDYLYIDFDLPIGENWQSFGEYTAVIEKKDFAVVVPAGNFKNCIQVFFDIPRFIDDEMTMIFAPGVGMIESHSQIGALQLTSARL